MSQVPAITWEEAETDARETLQALKLYEVPKPAIMGIFFGHLIPGWSCADYLIKAILDEKGYETDVIWGVQGSGKSSRGLQKMFWMFKAKYCKDNGLVDFTPFQVLRGGQIEHQNIPDLVDLIIDTPLTEEQEREIWLEVLDVVIFKPGTLVDTLEAVPDNEILIALMWDDIGVHYPSSTFQTDIEQYQAVDATWAAIRTKAHVVVITIPLIDRLAKNVKDNATLETYIGKNQMELINRIFRLPGTKRMESNFFKFILEDPDHFDLYVVPKWVWRLYWRKRINLTKEALASLRQVSDMEDHEDYIWVVDAAKICRDQELKYSTSTIQQDISRSVLRGKKIGGRLMVHIDDFIENFLIKGGDQEVARSQVSDVLEKRKATRPGKS